MRERKGNGNEGVLSALQQRRHSHAGWPSRRSRASRLLFCVSRSTQQSGAGNPVSFTHDMLLVLLRQAPISVLMVNRRSRFVMGLEAIRWLPKVNTRDEEGKVNL